MNMVDKYYIMAFLLPTDATASIVYIDKYFDTARDIVVSFDYACYGDSSGQGFCVFFTNSYATAVTGGGPGPGLGYTSTENVSAYYYTTSAIATEFEGVSYGELGVGFDVTGYFCTTDFGLDGLSNPVPNSITIRDSINNQFGFLYNTGNLATKLNPVNLYQPETVLSNLQYNRIRVRLTDLGKRIVVDIRRPGDLEFNNYVNLPINNIWPKSVRCCLSFSSDSTMVLKIKNFNVNGFITDEIGDDNAL
jgi:hypothetical protein